VTYLTQKQCGDNLAIMDERSDDLQGQEASDIALASRKGRCTLCTVHYARGTDFPACDQVIYNLLAFFRAKF